MKKIKLKNLIETLSIKKKDLIYNLYLTLFNTFKSNCLDYRAFIFYDSFFNFYPDKCFDYDIAIKVLNSILDYESFIELKDESIKFEKIETYHEDGGFSVSYKNPKTMNRMDIVDFSRNSNHNITLFTDLKNQLKIESANLNSSNYYLIEKEFCEASLYIKKYISRFVHLDIKVQEKWYNFFLLLMKIHFDKNVIESRKEIVIKKSFNEKVCLLIKLNKATFFKELKQGHFSIDFINSQSVFLYINEKEYLLELFFPSCSLSFYISEDIKTNHVNLKKLDVYLKGHAYLLDQYFKILLDDFTNLKF